MNEEIVKQEFRGLTDIFKNELYQEYKRKINPEGSYVFNTMGFDNKPQISSLNFKQIKDVKNSLRKSMRDKDSRENYRSRSPISKYSDHEVLSEEIVINRESYHFYSYNIQHLLDITGTNNRLTPELYRTLSPNRNHFNVDEYIMEKLEAQYNFFIERMKENKSVVSLQECEYTIYTNIRNDFQENQYHSFFFPQDIHKQEPSNNLTHFLSNFGQALFIDCSIGSTIIEKIAFENYNQNYNLWVTRHVGIIVKNPETNTKILFISTHCSPGDKPPVPENILERIFEKVYQHNIGEVYIIGDFNTKQTPLIEQFNHHLKFNLSKINDKFTITNRKGIDHILRLLPEKKDIIQSYLTDYRKKKFQFSILSIVEKLGPYVQLSKHIDEETFPKTIFTDNDLLGVLSNNKILEKINELPSQLSTYTFKSPTTVEGYLGEVEPDPTFNDKSTHPGNLSLQDLENFSDEAKIKWLKDLNHDEPILKEYSTDSVESPQILAWIESLILFFSDKDKLTGTSRVKSNYKSKAQRTMSRRLTKNKRNKKKSLKLLKSKIRN